MDMQSNSWNSIPKADIKLYGKTQRQRLGKRSIEKLKGFYRV